MPAGGANVADDAGGNKNASSQSSTPTRVLIVAKSPRDVTSHLNDSSSESALALSGSASLSTAAPATAPTTPASTFLASFSRTILFLVGMMLKRPARLFRPSKVSSTAFLSALAQRDGRSLTPGGLLGLVREYGPWSLVLPLVPPLVLNTALTTLLFTTHSLLSSLFTHQVAFFAPPPPSPDLPDHHHHQSAHPTLLAAVAGAGAGVAQSTLALPIEKLVRSLSRVISGKPASGATATSPPLTSKGSSSSSSSLNSKTGAHSTTSTPRLAGSAKARRDTLAWLKELRGSGMGLSSYSMSASGAGGGSSSSGWGKLGKLGFEGWRWGAAKDGVGYALFFATFDASRRLALRVRRALEDHALSTSSATLAWTATASAPRAAAWFGLESLGDDGEDDKEGGLGMRGTRLARTGQAIILILGGCLAGTLFALSSRPFDAVLHLLRSPHHLSPSASALPENRQIARGYILSHLRHPLHPGRRNPKYRTAALGTGPLPAVPLIIKTYKARGPVYFFGPQAGGMHKIGGGGSVWRRVGFKLIGVAPWSLGFLAFAWAGGEL